jgi:O-antigen ligase
MGDSTAQRRGILHPATGILAALVLWLPLPFGSVSPPWPTVLQLAAFAALLATAPWPRLGRAALLAAASLAGVAVIGALQAVPLPPTVARLLSPGHLALASSAATVAGKAGGPSSVHLSLAPAVSLSVALTWLAVAAVLLASAAIAGDRPRRRTAAIAFLVSALFQVLYGAQSLAGDGLIWGMVSKGDTSRLRGTFVNPDHLAVYLEVALAATIAWVWWTVRRVRREPLGERTVMIAAPPVLVWVILFVGLAFTGSRAGILAVAFGSAVQGLLMARTSRRWRPGMLTIGLLAVGVSAVAAMGLDEGFGRWLATSRFEMTWNDRLVLDRAALALWQRFPLLGTGLGTFRDAFTLIPTGPTPTVPWHAHNDWLELLATTGVAGAVGILVGLAVVIRALVGRLDERLRSEDRATALAALGALAAVGVHSLLDFGLTMPATAATLAALCGAALGTPNPRSLSEKAELSALRAPWGKLPGAATRSMQAASSRSGDAGDCPTPPAGATESLTDVGLVAFTQSRVTSRAIYPTATT